MRKKQNKLFKLASILVSINLFFNAGVVRAEEYVISDNGSESANEISIANTSSSDISQENSAQISNDINTDANTGGNETNGNNGGETTTTTGNVETDIEVSNSANYSVVNKDCCTDNGAGTVISGNGSDSNNSISINENTSETVTVTQFAKITTSINGYANTGRNRVSDNTGGKVTIRTGDINVSERIINAPVNFSEINIMGGTAFGNIKASVKDNGADSTNNISYQKSYFPKLIVENNAYIANYSFWNLNTGNNEASDNTDGDVVIETGDIDFYSLVNNVVNKSIINLDCGCEEEDDNDGEEEEEEKEHDDKEEKKEDKKENKIPSGDELKAGGPGILGLSDTSGNGMSNVLMFVGLAMTGGGGKILYGEARKIFKKKK